MLIPFFGFFVLYCIRCLYFYLYADRVYFGIGSILGYFLLYVLWVSLGQGIADTELSTVFALLTFISFVVVTGGIHAIAGPILSGVNLSIAVATLWSGDAPDPMFWSNFLDFMGVNSTFIQWLIVALSTILGFTGTMSYFDVGHYFKNIFDTH